MGYSPFYIIYGRNPNTVLDLASLPTPGRTVKPVAELVSQLQDVHDVVKQRLADSNARYKQAANKKRREVIFEPGDFVWAVMMKEHHPIGEYRKLTDRKIGPLEVLERLNNHAYRLKLSSHFKTSDVFNIKHLIPYVGDFSDNDIANSRANSFQPGGTDAVSIEEELECQDSHPK